MHLPIKDLTVQILTCLKNWPLITQPQEDLISTVKEIKDNLVAMDFNDPNYRESMFIRLKVLDHLLQKNGMLNSNLEWIFSK